MGYNPADYAEIKNQAKEMSKPELEDYFITKKNDNHTPCCAVIFIILFLVGFLFFVGMIGYSVAVNEINFDLDEISDSIAQEVCQISDDFYVSEKLFSKSSFKFKIDCQTFRVK